MTIRGPLRRLLPGPGNTSGVDGGMLSGISETLSDFIQCASVTVPSAQILTMFTTGIVLLPAPEIAGRANVIHKVLVRLAPGTQFTSGGAVQIQYGTTGNNGGTLIGATIPAATINSASASSTIINPGANITALIDTPIAITNATGVFATGTGSLIVYMWYSAT